VVPTEEEPISLVTSLSSSSSNIAVMIDSAGNEPLELKVGSENTTTVPNKEKEKIECSRSPIHQPFESELPQISLSKSKRQASSEGNIVATPADDASADIQSTLHTNSSKQERRMSTLGKKIKISSGGVQVAESTINKANHSTFDAVEVRRGRGRPRRNPGKDITNHSGIVSVDGHKVEDDNLEWVLCEKCEKWRRLPSHISADDLPEQWYCELNTWSPECASCVVPEDKADGMQDIGCIGATGGMGIGKLTYRNLIFGSTGRKLNKQVTEKARAAESLFSIHYDEDNAPSRVLYADSSAFVARNRPNLFLSDESEKRMSVLELMSHSSLWSELRNAAISRSSTESCAFLGQYERATRLTSYTYETLPIEMKQQMKEIVLLHLGDDTKSMLSGEELFARGKNTTLVPSLSGEYDNARRYWTINVVVTTAVQLVKEGRVECVQQPVAQNSYSSITAPYIDHYVPYYRKAVSHGSKRSTVSNESTDEQNVSSGLIDDSIRSRSRFMKIAKPWKRMRVTDPLEL
jgi:CW-type Zinc Finger